MSEPSRDEQKPLQSLPFPPITPQHILNTSFHSWYPSFRSLTPKARLIALSPAFLAYLRSDGIILPPEHKASSTSHDPEDSGYDDEGLDDEPAPDPSEEWAEIHAQVAATIKELGGKVLPKLNWSSPKDATWIAATNDMECRSPNDVYLLLKSSDFITHDLEHCFDGCDIPEGETAPPVPYHLVLRKAFNLNPALEFRCFVRARRLVAVSQREMNYFDFLSDLRPRFQALIQEFVDEKFLAVPEGKKGFPDDSFVLDVYIPPPYERVWLIDINPWAARTDPLLFSWLELLTLEVPSEGDVTRAEETDEEDDQSGSEDGRGEDVVRIPINLLRTSHSQNQNLPVPPSAAETRHDEAGEAIFTPEFRLVNRDDPEAYQFTATKYSAHKLPKDVVDASLAPGGMKDMMEEWKKVMDGQVEESDSEDDVVGVAS